MTVPLPNISPAQNVTIKEGLEASLQDLERPGGHNNGNLTPPPTKTASVPNVRKMPPVATNVLGNSKEERKFRREKKKKQESSTKLKKKKRLSTKKKSRREKVTASTTTKPPFYPTPRPDQQKEYTYILNHTELVPIEPEAPEPIFWNEEALKLKILGEQGYRGKNKRWRRKTVRPLPVKTKSERVKEEDLKNNLKSINYRRQPLDEDFGMRYQTVEDTDNSRYHIVGSKKAGLGKENYIKSKGTFSNFGSNGKSVGRKKTRNSILSIGDDYSNILKREKIPPVFGKNRRMTTTYEEPYKPGQNRRSSYFEQGDQNDVALYDRRPETNRYLRRNSLRFSGLQKGSPKIVGLQREIPKIGGFQRESPKTIGLQTDLDQNHIEYGFVPSPASRSTLSSSGKELGHRVKQLVQNSRIRNFDSTKVYKKPRHSTTTRKTHEKVLSLGQPKIVKDKSKSSINDMKLLDYYRSEYSLERGKETSSYNADAYERPIKWKSKKYYNTTPRHQDPSNNEAFPTSLEVGHHLEGFNSIKTTKPSTRRSYYEPVRTNPIHVDKFVSHSSTGEGVEENVYIVYPDTTHTSDFVYPDTPSMRTGRTSSKVCP